MDRAGLAAGDYNMTVSVLEVGRLWGTYFRQSDFREQEVQRYTQVNATLRQITHEPHVHPGPRPIHPHAMPPGCL